MNEIESAIIKLNGRLSGMAARLLLLPEIRKRVRRRQRFREPLS